MNQNKLGKIYKYWCCKILFQSVCWQKVLHHEIWGVVMEKPRQFQM